MNVRLRSLYKFLLQNGSYFTPSHLSEVLGEAWSFQVVKDSLSAGRLSPLTVEVGAAALLGLIGWVFLDITQHLNVSAEFLFFLSITLANLEAVCFHNCHHTLICCGKKTHHSNSSVQWGEMSGSNNLIDLWCLYLITQEELLPWVTPPQGLKALMKRVWNFSHSIYWMYFQTLLFAGLKVTGLLKRLKEVQSLSF